MTGDLVQMPDPRDYPSLSTAQVAALLGRNAETIRRMVHRGELQAYVVAGKWGFKPADIDHLAFATPVVPAEPLELTEPTPMRAARRLRGSVARLDEIERDAAKGAA